jgi:hypothetical protein
MCTVNQKGRQTTRGAVQARVAVLGTRWVLCVQQACRVRLTNCRSREAWPSLSSPFLVQIANVLVFYL